MNAGSPASKFLALLRATLVLRATLMALLLATSSLGCSNWMHDNDYRISGRTMDLGGFPTLDWALQTVPAGSKQPYGASTRGFVGFVPTVAKIEASFWVTGGLNDAGLSCDSQTLIETLMPPPTNTSADLNVFHFCAWVLGAHTTAAGVRDALVNGTVHVWGGKSASGSAGQHFSVRDASGASIVVEWMGGQSTPTTVQVYDDPNDGKKGYGLMTNEPEYPWQLRALRHFSWKQGLARPSVAMPGSFYPDERFLRLHLVKSALPPPKSQREAIQHAAHVLNVVTVPMGAQMGTDSGAGEGAGDHTMWGTIYDHKEKALYFRTMTNMNLQRVQLSDLKLGAGAAPKRLALDAPALPWYADASGAFE